MAPTDTPVLNVGAGTVTNGTTNGTKDVAEGKLNGEREESAYRLTRDAEESRRYVAAFPISQRSTLCLIPAIVYAQVNQS
jgi:hypothetical protein